MLRNNSLERKYLQSVERLKKSPTMQELHRSSAEIAASLAPTFSSGIGRKMPVPYDDAKRPSLTVPTSSQMTPVLEIPPTLPQIILTPQVMPTPASVTPQVTSTPALPQVMPTPVMSTSLPQITLIPLTPAPVMPTSLPQITLTPLMPTPVMPTPTPVMPTPTPVMPTPTPVMPTPTPVMPTPTPVQQSNFTPLPRLNLTPIGSELLNFTPLSQVNPIPQSQRYDVFKDLSQISFINNESMAPLIDFSTMKENSGPLILDTSRNHMQNSINNRLKSQLSIQMLPPTSISEDQLSTNIVEDVVHLASDVAHSASDVVHLASDVVHLASDVAH